MISLIEEIVEQKASQLKVIETVTIELDFSLVDPSVSITGIGFDDVKEFENKWTFLDVQRASNSVAFNDEQEALESLSVGIPAKCAQLQKILDANESYIQLKNKEWERMFNEQRPRFEMLVKVYNKLNESQDDYNVYYIGLVTETRMALTMFFGNELAMKQIWSLINTAPPASTIH